MVREGIHRVCEGEKDIKVCAEACDGAELLELVEKHHPDVVILDIAMPRLSGLEALKLLRSQHPDVKAILLSFRADAPVIQTAVSLGADGYLLKNTAGGEIPAAIREVMRGGCYFSPPVARDIIDHLREPRRPRDDPFSRLSGRERQVLRLIAEEPRLMPHLHLSLQAGDDMILKRMRRRHSRESAVGFCERVRRLRPDMAFGADLIAGFPTETEAGFRNTLALVADCGLTYLHVFPYSVRPGTPAARMPQVPPRIRKARAKRLRDAGQAALAAFLESRIGTRADVLVEIAGFGRSEHYAPVELDVGAPGEIRAARITGAAQGRLQGCLAA